MTFRRKLLRGLKYVGLFFLAVILLVIVANAFDESLSAEAKSLIERPLPKVVDDENLFHATLGFNVISADPAENADFGRIGTRLRTQWLKDHAGGKDSLAFPMTGTDTPLTLIGNREALCGRDAQLAYRCLTRAVEHREALTRQLADNAEFLRRYHALTHYTHYVYDLPLIPASPFLAWSPVFEGRRLAQTEIALQVVAGDTVQAIRNLRSDLEFWRQLLDADHGFLIDKMVAVAGLREGLLLAGEILRRPELSHADYEEFRLATAPLTAKQISLASTLEDEFLYQRTFVEAIRKRSGFSSTADAPSKPESTDITNTIARYFFQPNATLNRNIGFIRDTIADVEPPCSTLRQREDARGARSLHLLDFVYNPFGNIFSAVSGTSYTSYARRVCDLDGLNRIVGLQLAIHEQAIAPEAIPDFIKTAGAEFFDPYTNAPMIWNAEHGLSFGASDPRMKELLPWPI